MRVTAWRMAVVLSVTAHLLLALLLNFLPDQESIPHWRPERGSAGEFLAVMDIYEPGPRERVVAWSSGGIAETPRIEGKEPGGPPTGGAEESTAPPSAAVGANGPGEAAPLFPVPGTAQSVVFVIDRSGSMGEAGRLALARRELAASLRRLPESTRFQVVAYNRRAETLRIAGRMDLVPATPANISEALLRFDTLTPEGGTDHLAALRQALLLQSEVVYFLTDADDLRPADVTALTQFNRRRTAIHVIELTLANRDRDEMPMHVLARSNQGSYRAVDTDH